MQPNQVPPEETTDFMALRLHQDKKQGGQEESKRLPSSGGAGPGEWIEFVQGPEKVRRK